MSVTREHRREFFKLLMASFISQSGSYFLTLALAGFIFLKSASIVKASLVFAMTYLPAIFFGSLIGNWIDHHLSRRLLIRTELASIAVSAFCGLCVAYEVPLIAISTMVALRSILLFISRSGGMKWLKLITPDTLEASRIKLYFFSFFLSTAVAGLLTSIVMRHARIRDVIIVDVATYMIGVMVLITLQPVIASQQPGNIQTPVPGTFQTVREIMNQPRLAEAFISVCIAQALFQGGYSVMIFYLPINRFGLLVQGMGVFQVAASAGIIIGFLIVWGFQEAMRKSGFSLGTTIAATSALLLCTIVQTLIVSLLSFLMMNAAYECLWLQNSTQFGKLSPHQVIGRYQFVLTSSASALMAIATLCYALLIERFGLSTGAVSFILAVLCVWAAVRIYLRKAPLAIQA